MKRQYLTLLLCLLCWIAQAQTYPIPAVPNNIYFADMRLEIQESGRNEIQKIVDALLKHPGYFQKKVELADAYFPLIERTFLEEGLPTDFKYLALQESGLVSDAVSTSNAVGFWQFKEGSATELGVRVNAMVDERKHIIESSRGAAKYMIRSNAYYKNWFNSLLSYYQGLTGTKALTKTSDIGAKSMQVDDRTNKYLLTFLAHKVAYENFVGKNPKPTLTLQPLKAAPGQSLMDIAMATQVAADEVQRYNKWLLASTVPADKEYYVLIPSTNGVSRPVYAQQSTGTTGREGFLKRVTGLTGFENKEELKIIAANRKAQLVKENGLDAIVAQVGDNKDLLAIQGGISTRRFLKYNDLRSFDEIVPGRSYYLQSKRSKADTEYHVARTGETMHDVSQKYAVKLSKLLRMNRMLRNQTLKAGRVVWMQHTRPSKTPIEYRPVQDEVAPQNTEVLAQQPVQTTTPVSAAPAPAPVATVPATASTPSTTTAPVSSPANATASTTPAQPKERVISVEVEDPAFVDSTRISTESSVAGTNNTVASNSGESFPSRPNAAPISANASSMKVHVVKQGETLYSISRLYSVSVADLQAWNQLNGGAISIGQQLTLSGSAVASTTTPATTTTTSSPATNTPVSSAVNTHTVATGETLYSISRKYGVTVQNLQEWNALNAGTGIAIGQVLSLKDPDALSQPQASAATLPVSSSGTTTGEAVIHKVSTGESMYQISRQYGVTVNEIMEWNNKADYNVNAGENLTIKPKK